jgi:hypothetical protein
MNNGLLREEKLGRMFSLRAGTTYDDAARAYRNELKQWDPIIDQITDLFLRMRTQDAEVAATVHFAARSLTPEGEGRPSETEVLEEVKRWKQRRRPPLKEEDAARAIRNLNLLGWLQLRPSEDLPVKDEALVDA